MRNLIKSLLQEEKIEYFGVIPFDECRVINQGLYDRSFESLRPKSVIMLLVPYYSGGHEERNVSLYAVPRDYHLYFKQLYARLESKLKEAYPDNFFAMFADHSPIGETYAAAKCGLGIIGDKFQLINEKYGSYTFLGGIFTDAEFDDYDINEVAFCSHCGKCSEACPVSNGCLSEITQKKGELSDFEINLIKENNTAWGCDLCRTSCPMNAGVEETPIEFFRESLMTNISCDEIERMSRDDFTARAFAWRGKKTILRNLKILKES